MTLFIDSKHEIGKKVMNSKHRRGKVVDIGIKQAGSHYVVMCLVEYEDRERHWTNEFDLAEDAE